MSSKYNTGWYVAKPRLQLFAPFDSNFAFEIDKTDASSVLVNITDLNRFQTKFDNNDNEGDGYVADYTLNGISKKALTFKAGSWSLIPFNAVASKLISSMVYGAGRVSTINYWVFPSTTTSITTDTEASVVGALNNVILSDSYDYGYSFGIDTHTSMMSLEDSTNLKNNWDVHFVSLADSAAINDSNISEVEKLDGDNIGRKISIPARQWIMVTQIIDHTDINNMKIEIHLRYNNNGNFYHYWMKRSRMNIDDVSSIVSRASITTTWQLGGSLQADGSNGRGFSGGLRNFMLYNCILTTEQQDTIFNNGIDPYQYGSIQPNDFDQYDSNLWGKYAILSTGSKVRIEKTNFSDLSIAPANGNRTIMIASRDNGEVNVIGRDISEGEAINPDVSSTSDASFEFGSVSTTAWRNGSINGDRILGKDAHSIYGGSVNGYSDLMNVSPLIDPETLPSGRYMTNWEVEHQEPLWNINYPEFLPLYYYRDMQDFNAGMSASINEVFWDSVNRFEKILWTKPRSEESANDVSSGWQPIYWSNAIYEINREGKFGPDGYKNCIRLTLRNLDNTVSAEYVKHRSPDGFTSWMFIRLNRTENVLESEKLGRVMLPHLNIPSIEIPMLLPRINVSAIDNRTQSKATFFAGGSLCYWEWNNAATIYSKCLPDGTDNEAQNFYASGVATPGGLRHFTAVDAGWYEFTGHVSEKCNDNNYDITFLMYRDNGKVERRDLSYGDYVDSGSCGGGWGSATFSHLTFLSEGEHIRFYMTRPGNNRWLTIRRNSVGYNMFPKYINDVTVEDPAIYDSRYAQFVEEDVEGKGRSIVVTNTRGTYTRTHNTDRPQYE